MKIGVFGDVHLTKNMRTLQNIWEGSATCSIMQMYNNFDERKVDFAVCLGDFFDKPILEAKSLHLVLPILNIMNSRGYPTYLLLGNHEIDDNEHNILEYLAEYENIKPVTDVDIIMNDFTFIPYSRNIEKVEEDFIKDKYVFTHHDIYGSELAGGKTTAFFGVNPDIFKDAKLVMNGHVHLRSEVRKNVLNAGSLLINQQGELRVGEYPHYYILDADSGELTAYENRSSMIFLAINVSELDRLSEIGYDPSRLVLRVDYEGEIPEKYLETAHTSFRKLVSSIQSGDDTNPILRTSNFDLKNYLVEYIKKDPLLVPEVKDNFIQVGLEVLD